METRLPDEIEVAIKEQDARPPEQRLTPAEWVRENLFSSPFNSVLTILVGALAVWLVFALAKWVFVSADWRVVQVNLRVYMLGRFPIEKAWAIWASLWFVLGLAGLSWGVSGRRLRWTPGRIARRLVLTGVFVYVLVYLLEGLGVWIRIGISLAILAAAVAVGRAGGRHLRLPLVAGWALAFPVVIILIRLVAGVPPGRWEGFFLNVMLGVIAIFLSFPIGVLLALGRRSTLPVVSKFSVLAIEVIRGVPLVTLLIFGVFVLPFLLPSGVVLPTIMRAAVMMTIFSSAYVAEIVRGGLQGVAEGQYEASRALGLSTTRTMALVALPQALRNTIPAMIGHFISMFKDTSLIAAIGLADLLRAAQRAPRLEFSGDIRESLVAAAIIFWAVAFSMSRWSQRLERRLGVGER